MRSSLPFALVQSREFLPLASTTGTKRQGASDLTANISSEYVFFGGGCDSCIPAGFAGRIARRDSSNNVYYYFADPLGSSRSIVLEGQTTPCYDADFYPFGGEKQYTNTCPQNYKFEGKERDTETGNDAPFASRMGLRDDFGARYYSSVYGRWLSPDWSSVPAPVPYANLTNPQTLNLYAMVSDNPESFADLDGHFHGLLDWYAALTWAADAPPPPPPPTPPPPPPDPPAQQPPAPKPASQNTVTVEQVKGEGGNPAGHSAISVNGQQPVGLEQKKDSAAAALEGKSTPGAVKPIDPNRTVINKAVIPVSPEQAANIQKFLDNAKTSPPNYNLYHSNCAQFSESALRAGGVRNVPNDVTPGGLVRDLKGTSTDHSIGVYSLP